MQQAQIRDLLSRYMDDQLSPIEEEQLMQLLKNDLSQDWEGMIEEIAVTYPDVEKRVDHWNPLLEKILTEAGKRELRSPARTINIIQKKWFRYAAAILLVGMITWIFMLTRPNNKPSNEQNPQTVSTEINPGQAGAVLTLADGRKLVLDSMGNGLVASENGTDVKLKNGQLIYDAGRSNAGAMAYNIMSTPRGRQFQVTLPDGTAVWLNAASSIRYPTAFTGAERKVEITGEVYFEVKKDIRPFIVSADNRAEVTVLGTSFNVNSYSNEAGVKATLLEGTVQVSKDGQSVIIKPGEQADVQKTISVTKGVALEKVMAWKAGLFNFENVSLDEAMRQLERWYDIEVVYEKGIPNIELDGEMSKDITLNGLMNVLKELGVRYRLEGRRLIILR